MVSGQKSHIIRSWFCYFGVFLVLLIGVRKTSVWAQVRSLCFRFLEYQLKRGVQCLAKKLALVLVNVTH